MLNDDEVEVLRNALARYRGTLPIYLASAAAEADLLDEIVAKLG